MKMCCSRIVEPLYIEGPRDWQMLCVPRYNELVYVKSKFFFLYFTTTVVKK